MKKKQNLIICYFTLLFMGCNTKPMKNDSFTERPQLHTFIGAYTEYIKTLQDTNHFLLLFVNTNWKKSKYYVRGEKNTLFIQNNPPYRYFKSNGLWVFVYTGLENTYYKDVNDITSIFKEIKNDNPVVYNPPIWCLNITKDSIFIDKNPSQVDIQNETDAPSQSKKIIKFVPPNSNK